MEVHHHTNSSSPPAGRAGKKWSHYLFEFLMLFLAVFCGFLAEYQLEHIIEHQREKQFMESLLVDLGKDKASLQEGVNKGWIPIAYNDSLSNELQKKPLQGREKRIYHFLLLYTTLIDFTYHDRTVSQLKNSGGFRLIRDQNVSDALLDYDIYMRRSVDFATNAFITDMINNGVRLLYQTFEIYRVQYLQDSALAHLKDPENMNYPDDLKLLTYEETPIVERLNHMAKVRDFDKRNYQRSVAALHMNRKLDSLIRTEYHLK